MIRYTLRCGSGHGFEGWFASSDAFDRQQAVGAVTCPHCGGTDVAKALMAPAVGRRREAPAQTGEPGSEHVEAPREAPPAAAVLAADPRARALARAVRELRRHVEENAEYVGDRFAAEARRIHDDDAERRDIYGEASVQEVRDLLEDGIEVHPLPLLPDERN